MTSPRAAFSPVGTLTLAVQGVYYLITGAWPVAHRTSYEALSGVRVNYASAVIVGAVTCLVGGGLLWAVRQRHVPTTAWTLAIGVAAAFFAFDVWYVLGVVIPRVYVADAIAQGCFIVGATIGWWESRRIVRG